MDCKQVREMLSLYIDNLIENDDAREIEAHLAICSECRREYEELKHLTQILSELPEVTLPAEFDERLHAALLEVNAERAERIVVPVRKKRSFMKSMTSIAAIFVVGIFAIAMYNNSDQLMTKVNIGNDGYDYAVTESMNSDDDLGNSTADDASADVSYDEDIKYYNDSFSSDTSGDTIAFEPENGRTDGTETEVTTLPNPVVDQDIEKQEEDVADEDNADAETDTSDVASEETEYPEITVSGGAVSRGGTAYDKLMLLYSTDGAIFVGRDLTAVHYYMDQLDILLEDTEFEILSCEKQDGIWTFEVETVSTDEEGNELRETVVYHGQDGTLWTETEQL